MLVLSLKIILAFFWASKFPMVWNISSRWGFLRNDKSGLLKSQDSRVEIPLKNQPADVDVSDDRSSAPSRCGILPFPMRDYGEPFSEGWIFLRYVDSWIVRTGACGGSYRSQ